MSTKVINTYLEPNQVDGFRIVPHTIWEDPALTGNAVKLLGYLQSRPPGWEYKATHAERVMRCKRAALRTAFKSLEAEGLVVRQGQGRKSDGTFGSMIIYSRWTVATAWPPSVLTGGRSTDTGSTDSGSPDVGQSPPLVSTDLVSTDLVSTENDVPASPKPSRRSAVPDGYEPRPADVASATRAGLDFDGDGFAAETIQFVDHHRAKGSRMADWDAAWRTWMRSSYRKRPAAAPAARLRPGMQRLGDLGSAMRANGRDPFGLTEPSQATLTLEQGDTAR